ncbi:hypothetical protein ACN4EG_02090 [Alkalinema pantanalense CENA528]
MQGAASKPVTGVTKMLVLGAIGGDREVIENRQKHTILSADFEQSRLH